jgi:hypothetical protein
MNGSISIGITTAFCTTYSCTLSQFAVSTAGLLDVSAAVTHLSTVGLSSRAAFSPFLPGVGISAESKKSNRMDGEAVMNDVAVIPNLRIRPR